MPTPLVDSKALGASTERTLGVGECLGLIALIFLPGVGFAGLTVFSVTHFRPHLRGVARAALLWHVLFWSALAAVAFVLAVRLGAFLWKLASHLGPVR